MKWNNLIKTHVAWKGITADGQYTQSTFEGGLRALKQHLNKRRIALVDYAIKYQIQRQSLSRQFLFLFTKDLSMLLNHGFILTKALYLLSQRHNTQATHSVIHALYCDIKKGKPLSEAMIPFSTHFPASYRHLIRAAEQSNQLPFIIENLAKQIAFNQSIRANIQKATVYPLATLLFTLFITAGMIWFAIPKFQSIFSNFNATLPASTQIVISLSSFIKKHGVSLFFATISLGWITRIFFRKTLLGKHYLGRLLFKSPILKHALRYKTVSTWASILSICLQSKLTLTDSLKLANDNISIDHLKKYFDTLPAAIANGNYLHETLKDNPLFNSGELYLIETGEQSATLDITLAQIATDAASKLAQLFENLSKWLEPVIMLILAFIAGGLIITMYLPIFQIGTIL